MALYTPELNPKDRAWDLLIKKHPEMEPVRVMLPFILQPIVQIGIIKAAPGDLVYFDDGGIYRALADDFDRLARGIYYDQIGSTAYIRKIGPAWLPVEDVSAIMQRGQTLWLSKTISGTVFTGTPLTDAYQQAIGHVINTRRAQGMVYAACNIVDPTQSTG